MVYDIVIIGGGIVGLATARALLRRHPHLRLMVVEKEKEIGVHQTGRNSGVIHSGIYYRPGSLKAILCRQGLMLLRQLCEDEGVTYKTYGKVIVATTESQIPVLRELERRGQANGLQGLRWLSREELQEIEPHVAGVAALNVQETGIVNFAAVAQAISRQIEGVGGVIKTSTHVLDIKAVEKANQISLLETNRGGIRTRLLINCAGLHSDRVAVMMGLKPDLRIIPFRGEYYMLRTQSRHLVQRPVYPVPDPRLPFLGVHFTPTLDGRVEAGPNAVLAFAREGYTRSTVVWRDLAETVSYPGFLRLGRRYWRTGLAEMYRSYSKRAFIRALQELVPEITEDDVESGPAGVRAQAVSRDGALVDDFRILQVPGAIHVLNAPSPAATASLAIGNYIADKAEAVLPELAERLRSRR